MATLAANAELTWGKDCPHPDAGKIVQATLSSCCNTSTSSISGYDKYGQHKPHHFFCNKCKKDCKEIKVDYWVITEAGKYRKI